MDDKKKKLRKMAIWTIAIFATVFAIFMALFWMLSKPVSATALQGVTAALSVGWPIFAITAALCLGVYFGYKLYLDRKK